MRNQRDLDLLGIERTLAWGGVAELRWLFATWCRAMRV